MKTLTLAEVIAGAERAYERVKLWPQWKREIGERPMSYEIAIALCDAEIKRLEFNEATKHDFGDEHYAADDVPDYQLCRQFFETFQDPYIVREILETLHRLRGRVEYGPDRAAVDELMRKIGGGK